VLSEPQALMNQACSALCFTALKRLK